MKQQIKNFFHTYRHAWLQLYFIFYLIWFFYLESTVTPKYWIYCWLDDLIPFCEYFIIPYYLWFGYVAVVILYFLFNSKSEYFRLCGFLFIGMTLCMILYMIFPNGQSLRPEMFPRDNLFTDLVRSLYGTDTCTNVCPSIHTYNSLGVHIAVCHSQVLRKKPAIQIGSLVLCILIILSTVFLKQHSAEDVLWAFVLAVPLYWIFYRTHPNSLFQRGKRAANHPAV